MIFEKTDSGWTLEFEKMEAFLLASALNQLLEDYRLSPEDLRKMRRGSYKRVVSSHKEGARQMQEEQELLEDAETMWRAERESILKGWMQSYEPGDGWALELPGDEIEVFLNVLNDRRLYLATRHQFTVEELDSPPEDMADENVRAALWEIHYLAMFQETCLRLMEDGDDDLEMVDGEE